MLHHCFCNTLCHQGIGSLSKPLAPSHFPLCEGPWAWDQALAGWAKPAKPNQTNQPRNHANQEHPPTKQAAKQPAKRTTLQKIEPPTDQVSNDRSNPRTYRSASQPANLTSQPNHRAGLKGGALAEGAAEPNTAAISQPNWNT